MYFVQLVFGTPCCVFLVILVIPKGGTEVSDCWELCHQIFHNPSLACPRPVSASDINSPEKKKLKAYKSEPHAWIVFIIWFSDMYTQGTNRVTDICPSLKKKKKDNLGLVSWLRIPARIRNPGTWDWMLEYSLSTELEVTTVYPHFIHLIWAQGSLSILPGSVLCKNFL